MNNFPDQAKPTTGCFWPALAALAIGALAIWGILSLDSTPQDEVVAAQEAAE